MPFRRTRTVRPWVAALLCIAVLGSLAPVPALRASGADNFRALKKQWDKSESQTLTERLPILEEIGRCEDPAAGQFLSKLFAHDDDPESESALHTTLIWILVQRGDAAATEALVSNAFRVLNPNSWRLVDQAFEAHPPKPEGQEWLLERGYKLVPGLEAYPQKIVLAALEGTGDARAGEAAKSLLGNRKIQPSVQAVLVELIRKHRIEGATKKISKLYRVHDADLQVAVLRALRDFEATEHSKTFRKGLESRFWQVRVTAVDIFGGTMDPEVVPDLIPMLEDSFSQVQIAAVRALRKIGGRGVIQPLIDALEEAPGRVRDDIADTLLWLTGEDLGPEHLAWSSWWAQHGESATVKEITREEFEKRRAEAAKSTTGTYYGLRVISEFVTFVVDVSGSMNEPYFVTEPDSDESGRRKRGTGVDEKDDEKEEAAKNRVQKQKIQVAREELARAVRGMRLGTEFNIIAFDAVINPWHEGLIELDEEVRSDALAYIESLAPGGTTNIFDTLLRALEDESVNTIFFLSDGAPTAGSVQAPDEILRRVRQLNEIRKVKIHTIGFHLDPVATDLMRRLAEENHGTFVER